MGRTHLGQCIGGCQGQWIRVGRLPPQRCQDGVVGGLVGKSDGDDGLAVGVKSLLGGASLVPGVVGGAGGPALLPGEGQVTLLASWKATGWWVVRFRESVRNTFIRSYAKDKNLSCRQIANLPRHQVFSSASLQNSFYKSSGFLRRV